MKIRIQLAIADAILNGFNPGSHDVEINPADLDQADRELLAAHAVKPSSGSDYFWLGNFRFSASPVKSPDVAGVMAAIRESMAYEAEQLKMQAEAKAAELAAARPLADAIRKDGLRIERNQASSVGYQWSTPYVASEVKEILGQDWAAIESVAEAEAKRRNDNALKDFEAIKAAKLAARDAWLAANGAEAPMPETFRLDAVLAQAPEDEARARLDAAFEALSACDLIVVDTPGADTALSRAAHARADLIVTPMNDSFVDFDTLGVVDPVTLELKRPSLYSETVWNSRKDRALASGRSIDWVVIRNRLAPADARNRRRVDERVQALSRRAGFRVGPGLRDRVIYRELFPFGLTIADLSPSIRPVSMSLQHVAARQELRDLMGFLGLTPDGAQLAAQ